MPPRRRLSEAQKAALARANAARRKAFRAKAVSSSLPSTRPVLVDDSSPQTATTSGSPLSSTGPAPATVSSIQTVRTSDSSLPSTGLGSRSDPARPTDAAMTSSANAPPRGTSAGPVRDIPPSTGDPLSRSTSAVPTSRVSDTTMTPAARSASAAPTIQGPGPRATTADNAQPMDEDPPRETDQTMEGHDHDDESGISLLSGVLVDEAAMQDQEDALRNEGHAAQGRPPAPGPSVAHAKVPGPANVRRKSSVARGKRRWVEPPPDLEDGTDGEGPLWNKHFPLPDDAINSRRFVRYFLDVETELEAGFKCSSMPCKTCRENKVWCTYGTGLDFNDNERGAGIDKCDFCKVRGCKCDLIPGKVTKRQKINESLEHVYKKLEKLSHKTNDRKMAKVLGDLSREAEEVYRYYTKAKDDSSTTSSDSD